MSKRKTPGGPTDERSQRSLLLAREAARVAEENGGREIVILEMRSQTPNFDYFVLVTGTSQRQLRAMSEEIDRHLERDLHDKRMHVDGLDSSRWIVLDYGDVVIHLLDDATRAFYAIEALWADAPRVPRCG